MLQIGRNVFAGSAEARRINRAVGNQLFRAENGMYALGGDAFQCFNFAQWSTTFLVLR